MFDYVLWFFACRLSCRLTVRVRDRVSRLARNEVNRVLFVLFLNEFVRFRGTVRPSTLVRNVDLSPLVGVTVGIGGGSDSNRIRTTVFRSCWLETIVSGK